jgi:hypothetical protein
LSNQRITVAAICYKKPSLNLHGFTNGQAVVAVTCLQQNRISKRQERESLFRGLLLNKQPKSNPDSVDAKVFNLPVIHCKCGAEILLIRNAASTGKAIEWHTQNCSLTKKAKNPSKRMAELNKYLTKQVIDIAAEAQPEEKHSVSTHPV